MIESELAKNNIVVPKSGDKMIGKIVKKTTKNTINNLVNKCRFFFEIIFATKSKKNGFANSEVCKLNWPISSHLFAPRIGIAIRIVRYKRARQNIKKGK